MIEQAQEDIDIQNPTWGEDAPKGGKVVLSRIIKEKATVPLFFGQTLITSLRDMGYNSTTSALCEHVDNAIQWGATEVRVYFSQTGRKGDYNTDVLVFDNGLGMAPNVLKMATSFGGSMVYGNRSGIGRYGMGMKTAALSVSPIMDLYSWQEPSAIYNMTLDVEAIGKERTNLIELPDPTLINELPTELSDILTKPLSFPTRHDEQELFASDADDLKERLGRSGTIVFMPGCDRLTFAKARTLCEHAVKEMSRIYRRFLAKGLRLFVNNRIIEPFDPTYSIPNARHAKLLDVPTKNSRLVVSKIVRIKRKDGPHDGDEIAATEPVTVRLYALPIEEWAPLPQKVKKNDLRIYDDHTVSFVRNDREVFIGTVPEIAKRHGDTNWFRVQIDFSGALDEAFGVAANKQGVRPKDYVLTEISRELQGEIGAVREQIKRYQSEQTVKAQGGGQTPGESRAEEAEGLQTKPFPDGPAPLTEEEREQLDSNLRTLAIVLKRDEETDEEAFQRVKNSKYIIHYKHDEYWPFYHVDHRFGKVILTINTAHAFYDQLYQPLSDAAIALAVTKAENAPIDQPEKDEPQTFEGARDALIALQLMLLSLARTQGSMSVHDPDRSQLFDQFRKEWSATFQTQLTAP